MEFILYSLGFFILFTIFGFIRAYQRGLKLTSELGLNTDQGALLGSLVSSSKKILGKTLSEHEIKAIAMKIKYLPAPIIQNLYSTSANDPAFTISEIHRLSEMMKTDHAS